MNDKETENALIVMQYLKQLFVIIGGVSAIKLVSELMILLIELILS